MNTNELRNKRGTLVADARKILDLAETEKRELSAEDNQRWDAMHVEIKRLGTQIEMEERQDALDREISRITNPAIRGTPPDSAPNVNGHYAEYRHVGDQSMKLRATTPETRRRITPEYNAAFVSWLTRGVRGLEPAEYRALQADADISGGYLVPPENFVASLIQFKNNLVWMRQAATKYPLTTAETLGVPALDNDPADADWTSEIGPATEDSTMSIGKRHLQPHPSSKLLKVSNKLLRQSAIDVEQLVRERLGYKFAVTEEKAFLTGNGAGQPLGVFTANANGISTGRDFATGNTTTAITFDGLKTAKYGLKPQYRATASWMFHTDAISQIDKLKDGVGQYIWQQGAVQGQPDRLLNLPLKESVYAPNTFTTGLYVGILGDFSFYWIADALSMVLRSLGELYAVTDQTGYIARLETDGMPVLEEAFARVKLA